MPAPIARLDENADNWNNAVRFDNGWHTPPMLDVADAVLDDVELNIVWLNAHAEAVQVLKNCCLADSWQALR